MQDKVKRPRRKLPLRVVCERYGVCARTIDRWLAHGLLPTPMVINHRRYWDEEEIEAHERRAVANRKTASAAAPVTPETSTAA